MRTIDLSHHTLAEITPIIAEVLGRGGVVLMPMDTSYGLAADATSERGVRQVFDLKQRPTSKPLSVIVKERSAAERLISFTPAVQQLWDAFMPGELTLIGPVNPEAKLPFIEKSLGVRQPDHPLTAAVAEAVHGPYTATSANLTGMEPARSLEEFRRQAGEDLPDLAIDGGVIPRRPSSTVVSCVEDLEILREGSIGASAIAAATGVGGNPVS